MFTQALSEVRHHPGRFLSTLLAIAISVAFLAGSAVLTDTEGQAQGKSMSVSTAEADVVVALDTRKVPKDLGAVISQTPGVELSAPVVTAGMVASDELVSSVLNLVNVPPEPLRWATLTEGHWPTESDQVVLSAGAAKSMSVGVGDRLRAAGDGASALVVGVTNEPSGLFTKTGYAADTYFIKSGDLASIAQIWSIKAAPGVSPDQLVATLISRLADAKIDAKVQTGAAYRTELVGTIARDFDVFANVLWAFAAIALVVGMITIANTFAITVAQRRRQVGLLRAVGASGAQVRRRFFAEAFILGTLGSVLGLLLGIGLAAATATWSTAIFWGLALPWPQLLLAFALGIVATVVAAFVPIVRGTRVMPLEALQPALPSSDARRASVVRVVICGVFFAGGVALAVVSLLVHNENALLFAIAAGALISLAVLLGASLFVPSLLRAVGALVRPLGTVPRLAADNAERNPRRATATATALMLAVGLMVTLQVATASVSATMQTQLAVEYPVDLQVAGAHQDENPKTVSDAAIAKITQIPGVDDSVALSATAGTINKGSQITVLAYRDAVATTTGIGQQPSDGEVLLSGYRASGLPKEVTLNGKTGKVTLTVVSSRLVDYNQAMVSAATLAKIGKPVPNAVVWLSVPDREQAVSVMVAAADIIGSQSLVDGSIVQAALMESVLNILLAIATGLLAVAVLIALVGVGNTLSLSVIERSRESALLRALGLQASSLRAMLTIEALQVTAVGLIVGLVAGGFFGWLGAAATASSVGIYTVEFTINGAQTAIMIAVAVGAAALASILPGRRAAKAAPTEALAEV